MSRRIAIVALWIVATALIGVVARAAVGFADRAVFPEGQAIRVVDLAPTETTVPTTVVAAPTTVPPTTAAPTTTTLLPTTTTSVATTTLPSTTSSTTPTTVPESTTTTTSTSTTTVPATSTTTLPPVRTLLVAGGAVTVESRGEEVLIVGVVANEGFEYEITQNGPDHIEVLFRPDQGVGTSFVRCSATVEGADCTTS